MSRDTLTVVWGREGVPCPKERKRVVMGADGVDRSMIYGEPVEVPNTRFYRRRIAVGDLVEYKPPPRRRKAAEESGE